MDPIVVDAILSLIEDGKVPSVAMTKARLKSPVPMPVVISAIAAYKNDPEGFAKMKRPELTPPVTASDHSQLDRIEAKLDELLSLLKQRES
ncbi:hypothetical protein PALB_25890 [Pseudoalteromonas luteoviolacea B = ATCC 29581]|nr:hypothetical protein PALB_25890 [Pseudoalteromonas luteoviolacea B = ATCC 29581]